MWRAVQVWEALSSPFGAPYLRTARRLHWRALVAWNTELLRRGAPRFSEAPAAIDSSAPPLADAAWCLREGRAHPVAAAAWRAAGGESFAANVAQIPAERAAYVWAGASDKRFGPGVVSAALAITLAALAAWDTVVHTAARRAGRPLPSIYAPGIARYAVEPYPAEEFLDAVALRRRRVGDCEDLANDRVGELRAAGVAARTEFHQRRVPRVLSAGAPPSLITLFHIVARGPRGLEDPSRALGMRSE